MFFVTFYVYLMFFANNPDFQRTYTCTPAYTTYAGHGYNCYYNPPIRSRSY